MKAFLLLSLIVCSVSAVSRLQRMKNHIYAQDASTWDIAEGITGASAKGKVEGHESTLRDAYNGLTNEEKALITNPTTANRPYLEAMHKPPAIIMGLQYPDMPYGGPNVQALGDDLPNPDHVNAATFGTLFVAGSSGARNSFVANTHFGCLQFWHAMAPEPLRGREYLVWKNKDLSDLIMNGNRRIWNTAVAKLKAGNRQFAEFHLGRIIHTIGDSFARGHCFRDGACGKILVFQEYNAEKGNHKHDDGDKPAKNPQQFQCSVQHIRALLKKWAACVKSPQNPSACLFPQSVLGPIFEVHKDALNFDAGGAIEEFKSASLSATDAQTLTYAGKSVKVYFPSAAGRTKRYMNSDITKVCPNF